MFKKVDLDKNHKAPVPREEYLPTNQDPIKGCSTIERPASGLLRQILVSECLSTLKSEQVENIYASRFFLSKLTTNLIDFKGDTGAFLKSAVGAITLWQDKVAY